MLGGNLELVRYNSTLFESMRPYMPHDIFQEAVRIGYNPLEMRSSLYTLTSDVCDALRKRGLWVAADAITVVIKRHMRDLGLYNSSSSNTTYISFTTSPPSTDSMHIFMLFPQQVGHPSFETDHNEESAAHPLKIRISSSAPENPNALSSNPECDLSLHAAQMKIQSLLQHASARFWLDQFHIDLERGNPQETVLAIASKIRKLMETVPEILLPCLPENMSATPEFIDSFFQVMYRNAVMEFIERCARAGSETAERIASIQRFKEAALQPVLPHLFHELLGRQTLETIQAEIQSSQPISITQIYDEISKKYDVIL